MPHHKAKTIHTLHFYVGVPTSRPFRLGLSIAPFNSGTWTVSYDPDCQQVCLECTGVQGSVRVKSVRLVTWVNYKPDPERHVSDTGLRDAVFPPESTCRILARVNLPRVGAAGVKKWPATAQLEVELAEVGQGGVASAVGSVAVAGDDERAVIRAMAGKCPRICSSSLIPRQS